MANLQEVESFVFWENVFFALWFRAVHTVSC